MSNIATHAEYATHTGASLALLEALSALQTSDALLRRRLRDHLALRASEIAALGFIARLEGLGQPVRAIDVARNLGVTNGASSLIVARMIERGFLTRTENPRDGRGHHLHLTPEATRRMLEAIGEAGDEVRALIAGLSARDSRRLVLLLGAVTSSLDRSAPSPVA